MNKQKNRQRTVIKATEANTLFVPVTISVVVDTAYVASQNGQNISTGVYLIDNMGSQGSSGEGGTELTTVCNVGNLVSWNCMPLDVLGSSGDTVTITGITIEGGIFGNQIPQPMAPPAGEPANSYWIGQAIVNTNSPTTYQLHLKVTTGQLNPSTYYLTWDPFLQING